jgi:ectoine hydroxylase-related dioxygenase (phytanoyl-CoA dioxygenase family)
MIKLTPEERRSNTLNPETLQNAVNQVRANGYVVLESVLSADFVETLRADYMQIYDEALKTAPEKTFGNKHYRLYLPFRPPFTDDRIINSPFALPVFEALLGPEMVCHYFATNTCAPGSDYQPVHADTFNLYPEHQVVVPPFMMVLNIPLVDTTEENGPMDMWSGGSHLMNVPRDQIATLAETMHKEPGTMPAGSIMIRDGRMWHRGTRNQSNAPRPNIAIVYTRPWLAAGPKRIGIPQATFDNLPERLQSIYRSNHIGAPLDEPW